MLIIDLQGKVLIGYSVGFFPLGLGKGRLLACNFFLAQLLVWQWR